MTPRVRALVLLVLAIALLALDARRPQTSLAGGYTWVVDDGGMDCTTPADDSSSHSTITDALAIASAGQSIFVCSGLYAEPTLQVTQGVEIVGPAATPENDGGATLRLAPNAGTIMNITADGVTVRGFDFDATPPGIFLTLGIQSSGDSVTIADNAVRNATSRGISVVDFTRPKFVSILRNDISAAAGTGLACGCDNSIISHNLLNGAPGVPRLNVQGDSVAIFANTITGGGSNMYGNGNTFGGNNVDLEGQSETAFQVAGGSMTISGNTFANTPGDGLQAIDAFDVDVFLDITGNTFDSLGTAISLFDTIDNGKNITARIGGSPAEANTFRNPGTGLFVDLVGFVSDPIPAEYNQWWLCSLEEIEEAIHHQPDDPTLGMVDFDPFIDPGGCESPTPTASPSPFEEFEYGDINCDGNRTALDGLVLMQHAVGLVPEQDDPCATIGEIVDIPPVAGGGQQDWADIDCDGDQDTDDALALVGALALIPYDRPADCPEVFDGILIS